MTNLKFFLEKEKQLVDKAIESPTFKVTLWLDGYESNIEMREACQEYIYEQLNMTASSVEIEQFNARSSVPLLLEVIEVMSEALEGACYCHKLHPDFGEICGFHEALARVEEILK